MSKTVIAGSGDTYVGVAIPGRVHATASTNATNLKAAPGAVYGWHVHNNAAYAVFIKFYDKASAPVVGTDPILFTVPVAAGADSDHAQPIGIRFMTGVSYAITKLESDTDTTVLVAGDIDGVIGYL